MSDEIKPLAPGESPSALERVEHLIVACERYADKYKIDTSLSPGSYIKAHVGAMWLEWEKLRGGRLK